MRVECAWSVWVCVCVCVCKTGFKYGFTTVKNQWILIRHRKKIYQIEKIPHLPVNCKLMHTLAVQWTMHEPRELSPSIQSFRYKNVNIEAGHMLHFPDWYASISKLLCFNICFFCFDIRIFKFDIKIFSPDIKVSEHRSIRIGESCFLIIWYLCNRETTVLVIRTTLSR